MLGLTIITVLLITGLAGALHLAGGASLTDALQSALGAVLGAYALLYVVA